MRKLTGAVRPRLSVLFVAALLVFAACAVPARGADACSATFTPGAAGTFPGTFKLDRQKALLTVDLSGVPKDALVFRAELVLTPITYYLQQRPVEPTTVHPEGAPEKKLGFVAPQYVSLDALDAVREAVKAGRPLELHVGATCQGVSHLELSYTGGKPKAEKLSAVTGVKATHRAGQTMLVFAEPKLDEFPELKTGGDVRAFVNEFGKKHPGLAFRVWRSAEKITPDTIAKAALVGRVGPFTCWNASYHQGETDKQAPVRYRVADGAEPVAWGTGIYAYNPPQAGKSFYAVTVALDGEEDFSQLGADNTTAQAVDETVGLGEPVLQWVERLEKGWMFRPGPVVRMIYTRWESGPHSSHPSNPLDYVVAVPNVKVEPAPVGLHLHCWGGSLNGGYGWWHNAHRGAILIASNQVPYDWWTGYHESLGTCRTWGDGTIQPYSTNRMLGFLDWAAKQHEQAPEAVRADWRKLDMTRVFTAGISMGGAGAPMFAIRHGDRIAWGLGWVGVHVPEETPQFKGSYEGSYGPRGPAITMPDGKTSPWDHFCDPWWLRQNVKTETGFVIASNGKNDGAIGWPQAVKFARALQETRRPHMYNWALGGHGTRTLVGANFDIDVRTDQSLPAFTNCLLDNDIGTATPLTKEQIEAEVKRQDEEIAAGKRKDKAIDPFDGDPQGGYNIYLAWQTEDVVDSPEAWEMTVVLAANAPRPDCKVDITPRRLQQFKTPNGAKFNYTVTDVQADKVLAQGAAAADELDLLTLKQITLVKGKNRVKVVPAK